MFAIEIEDGVFLADHPGYPWITKKQEESVAFGSENSASKALQRIRGFAPFPQAKVVQAHPECSKILR